MLGKQVRNRGIALVWIYNHEQNYRGFVIPPGQYTATARAFKATAPIYRGGP